MFKVNLKFSQEQLFPTPTTTAFASLLASLVALSFSPILIRLGESELSPNAIIFNRFWISTVAFMLWMGFTAIRQKLSKSQLQKQPVYTIRLLMLLLGVGFVMVATLILWAWSLNQTSIANSTLMHNLAPVFTVLGGWLIWRKHFDTKFLMGMLVAMIGACILAYHDFSSTSGEFQGDMLALLSAGFLGLYPLIVEELRTQLSPVVIMTWCSAIGTLLLLPITILSGDRLFPSSLTGWLCVISLALICQILGLGLYAHSLKKLSSGFVSLCDLFVPVLSSQEAWVIFSESPSLATLMSFAVIVLGIYITSFSKTTIKSSDRDRTVPPTLPPSHENLSSLASNP